MAEASRWTKDIELSDDEEAAHPNIDSASYFRFRHEDRLRRMEDMKKKRDEINKTKEELKERKKELEAKRKSGADVTPLEKAYSADARQLLEAEKELDKKEALTPWNVDTIGHEVFSKTVINPGSKPKPLTKEETFAPNAEEKAERLVLFSKQKSALAKEFGMLKKFKDSHRFLHEHPDLICEQTSGFLSIWCLELAEDKKFDLMEHVSYQCMAIQFILQCVMQLDLSPPECVTAFFAKMMKAQPTGTDAEYQEKFQLELGAFQDRVRARAIEREEEARQERLGPGGLDPIEVFESLPAPMQRCFDAEDIPGLHRVLAQMSHQEGRYHMRRCIDSGLWCPSEDDLRYGEGSDSEEPSRGQ